MIRIASAFAALALLAPVPAAEAAPDEAAVKAAVDRAVEPLLARYAIPGMAVAVTVEGRRVFAEYGLAATEPATPVTRETLFELGSISKTFTVVLAAVAEIEGKLSLDAPIGVAMPSLAGSALGTIALHHLATHTAGGFPLQVPPEVKTEKALFDWFRAWKPRAPAGTTRSYANPSIGLLGRIAAERLGGRYATLMDGRVFPALGLASTHVEVPAAARARYAWGHDRDGKPVRVGPGLLAEEAYGVKSTSADMIRFVELAMAPGTAPAPYGKALATTLAGRYRSGPFVQDMIWEDFAWPVDVATVQDHATLQFALRTTPVTAVDPPRPPIVDGYVHKTGSTAGFGAYVAFVPSKRIGIVILANRGYPNEARVAAAMAVFAALLK